MPEKYHTAGEFFLTAYAGPGPSKEFLDAVEELSFSGIILFADNCEDHAALKESIQRIRERSDNRALIAIDQEGGRVCRLRGAPVEYRGAAEYAKLAEGGAQVRQRALAIYEKEFSAAAGYLADLGINLLLGPVCDLKLWKGETALDGRTFGADPEIASEFVRSTVRICHENGLACCLKHAPGLGRVSVDPHEKLGASQMTQKQFENVDSLPFKAGIAAGADSLMSSHFLAPEFDSFPVTFSKTIIKALIRNELSDNVALLSDDLNMGALSRFGSVDEIVKRCLSAGHDLLLTRNLQTAKLGARALNQAFDSGEIDEKRLHEARSKIARLKRKNFVVS